tara:strand:+ start:351 stop:500 length:150 start_codon:yes stop_codon:yes gene_type:complete
LKKSKTTLKKFLELKKIEKVVQSKNPLKKFFKNGENKEKQWFLKNDRAS